MCILPDMKHTLIVLMMVFSLVVTPLMIVSMDTCYTEVASANCVNNPDSQSDQDSNNALHGAHHCCGHSTAMGFTASTSLRIAMNIGSEPPLSAQRFSSAYQPGILLEPPSHV